MKRWGWLIVLAPTLLGSALALFFFLVYDPNHDHVVYLRADLGALSFLIGILLSMVFAFIVALLAWRERTHQRASSLAAEEHHRFLQRLDHELKNPLTAIRAGLANLGESNATGSDNATLASLETQALRMSRLSADLRKLAEIEVCPLERLPVDMPALLREAFQMAQERPEAQARKLTLGLPQAPWPLPAVQGDADLLLLAVHNLLENSLKFTRPGDTLELRASENGQELVIEVADTGPGIPIDEQPHVWEELFRGQSGRGVLGSGLGLSLVRAIIDRHGGRVSLRSRLDQGTVFTIHLPAG